MNIMKLMTVFMLLVFSNNLFAYGNSSSSKTACKKPKMSQFKPAHLAVVAPQSEFSFKASASTNPESIQVSVKNKPVSIVVKEEGRAYLISGKLPPALQDTYARITINASGTNGCKTTDGWLLKIEPVKP